MPLRLLFIHNNFPGQFLQLIRHLRERPDVAITFISGPTPNHLQRVRLFTYPALKVSGWAVFHERGLAVQRIIAKLLHKGENFDAVLAHLPFGDALYLRNVLPRVPFIVLPEFYSSTDRDLAQFFRAHAYAAHFSGSNVEVSQANNVIAKGVLDADIAVVPTKYQRAQFPEALQRAIRVLHEGLEDRLFEVDDEPALKLPSGEHVRKGDEVVTFATRSLEPLRGYDTFLRAAQLVAARRPNTRFLVAGNETHSYSGSPRGFANWRQKLEKEISLPSGRLIFLGLLERSLHINLLRISAAHVYLTAPFVVSWSLLEAMALRAPIIASATEPVEEFILDRQTGLLVDFFDANSVAERIELLLEDKNLGRDLGDRAGEAVQHLAAKRLLSSWYALLASVLPQDKRPTLS